MVKKRENNLCLFRTIIWFNLETDLRECHSKETSLDYHNYTEFFKIFKHYTSQIIHL